MRRAFTLVEVVVGVGLFAVLAASASVMLFTVLRSSRKAGSVGNVKSEGALAMNVIGTTVKFAKEAVCSQGGSRLDVVDQDGGTAYFELGTGRINSNLGYLTSPRLVVAGCGGVLFACELDGRAVRVCFEPIRAGAVDTTATATVRFQSRILLRNFGN